jgi:hypothetical protein
MELEQDLEQELDLEQESEQEEPNKKVKDMTPEELTVYYRTIKRNQRALLKQEKLKTMTIAWDEYEIGPIQQQRLSEHVAEVTNTIRSETVVTHRDEWIIHMISSVLYGLGHQIKQKVYIEHQLGMLVGGEFPDAAWAIAIDHIHCFPTTIMDSATFASLYKKFLSRVNAWSRSNSKFVSVDLLEILNRENAGTYEPQSPPAPIKSPGTAPSAATNIWTGLPSGAAQYLNGE